MLNIFSFTINVSKNSICGKYRLMKRTLGSPSFVVSRSTRQKFNHTMSANVAVTFLENPIKSQTDPKEYRVIQLQNGLKALLISDTTAGPLLTEADNADATDVVSSSSTDGSESDEEGEMSDVDDSESSAGPSELLSAASLTVGSGSFEESNEIPGLAHFLEHMVFMGSEKYPDENDFSAFVNKQGGHDNASTSWDYTNFYFECQPRHFYTALDKFSQFFISPLIKKDTMQREREAVESEFKLALPNDTYRKEQLLSSLAKINSVVNKFPWGNIESLGGNIPNDKQSEKDDEIREKLQEFRKENYVGSNMYLAVQSRHDLDTLQKWVINCFGSVLPGTKLPLTANKVSLPFDTNEFKRLYHVSPIDNVFKIELTWSLPSMIDKYECNPERYISWLLGHEGEGSLLNYLREKVWALELAAGCDDIGTGHNSQYLLFEVVIELTESGLQNIDNVINCVFSYLNLLKRNGPDERIFNEIKKISEIGFRFLTQPSAVSNVENLSSNMVYFPPKHYISGTKLLLKYQPDEITSFLNNIIPENVNIMILNKNSSEIYTHHEKWFNTPYCFKDITSEQINRWKNMEPLPEFHLPVINKYIAEDFTLLPPEINKEKAPEKIISDENGELWYKQDSKFKLPKVLMQFQLISPKSSITAKHDVLLEIYKYLLIYQLKTETYPANMAGIYYSIFKSTQGTGNGIGLRFEGFNDKIHMLVEKVFTEMVNFDSNLNENKFEAIKNNLKRDYYNIAIKPKKLSKDLYAEIITNSRWNILNKYEAFDKIKLHNIITFVDEFKKQLYIRGLIQGNISSSKAIDIMNQMKLILKPEPLPRENWRRTQICEIEIGSRACKIQSFNTASSNSVVLNTFFCGLTTIKDCCISDILMLLLGDAVFDTLRTKEQLGYDVSCRSVIEKGVLTFRLVVNNQEDKHSISHVENKVWEFLNSFEETLKKLSEDEYKELQESAKKDKMKLDIKLSDEFYRNWDEITSEEYIFNRRFIEHNLLGNISKDELIDWYKKYFVDISKTARHICVQVQGHCKSAPDNESNENEKTMVISKEYVLLPPDGEISVPIMNIEDYKKTLKLYPHHKIIN